MATPMGDLAYHQKITFKSAFLKIPYPTSSFASQTVIITGSNAGLGLEAARHVVRLGAAKVIIAVRNTKKGKDAAADIIRTTNVKSNVVEVWSLDLTSYDSIKAFAKRVDGLERLDAVLQNAGMMTHSFTTTKDGEELAFGTNTIGTALLGLLLLPKLRASAKTYGTRGRLAFVGSESYLLAKFNEANVPGSLLDALRDEKVFKANMYDRYQTSKLLLLHAVREIASRTPVTSDSNVVITTITPGICWSGLFRELPWFIFPIYYTLMVIFARTTEVGGRLLVDAVKPEIENEAHAAFLMDGKVWEE
jgi:NAD(P)-dependent dehydrogenase (short-subunit alcohol dehydrogenase family)